MKQLEVIKYCLKGMFAKLNWIKSNQAILIRIWNQLVQALNLKEELFVNQLSKEPHSWAFQTSALLKIETFCQSQWSK